MNQDADKEAAGVWALVGSRPGLQQALAASLGGSPADRLAAASGRWDLVVVDALAGPADCQGWPGEHAFAVVRGLKERRNLPVYVVVGPDDRLTPQLARFCLADGVLRWQPGQATVDLQELRRGPRAPSRPSVDAMLARLQADLAASGQRESTADRLLRFEREDSIAARIQDPETGLFHGAYATLKLDEEWKRARRFHQPLALLLLDLGTGFERLPEAERRTLLADAAGVFLNECRDIDVLARFAPGTFLFLLPGTGPDGAAVVARRLLQSLRERLAGRAGLQPHAGLAVVPSSDIPDKQTFLMMAEASLRRAESTGGDEGLGGLWE